MSIEIERQDQIDRYLRGEMPAAEAKSFEKLLQEDEALRTAYEETWLLAETIGTVVADRETKEAFGAVSEEELRSLFQEKKSGRRFLIRTAWMAAAILVVVVVMEFLRMPAPNSPEGVYYTYFEPYPIEEESFSRGTGSSTMPDETFRKVLLDYRQGYYLKALTTFESIEAEQGDRAGHTELLFYKAICQMELNRYADAVAALQQVVAKGEADAYYQPACWYLSLALLQSDEPAQALSLLKQIVEQEGFYAEKAREAIRRLEKSNSDF